MVFNHLKIAFLFILFNCTVSSAVESDDVITVMVSKYEPFMMKAENNQLKGLDILILTNFAEKYQLKIDFISTDLILKDIFSWLDSADLLLRDSSRRLVLLNVLNSKKYKNLYFQRH